MPARRAGPAGPRHAPSTLRAVPATAMTRRRALALGMAAGMAALLRPGLPAALAGRRRGGATFGLELAPEAFSDGVTGIVRARQGLD